MRAVKRRLLALCAGLCLLTGCAVNPWQAVFGTPTPEVTSSPTPEITASPAATPPAASIPSVYTDWSKLTPYEREEPLYSYSDHYCGSGPLRAWNGYGTLLPYVGAELSAESGLLIRYPLYGLMTAQGELVTAPIYANILVLDGFLLLYQGTDTLYDAEAWGEFDLTVAAPDGSWVREADNRYYAAFFEADGGLLALGDPDGGFTFWNTDGETVAEFPGKLFEPYLDSLVWSAEGGPWAQWWYNGLVYVETYDYLGLTESYDLHLYLDLATGQVLEEVPDGYPVEPDYGSWTEPPTFPGYESTWSSDTDPVTGEIYYIGLREDGGRDLLDHMGNLLWQDYDEPYISFPTIMDGKLALWPGSWDYSIPPSSCFSWYDLASGACIFRYPLAGNSD